MNNFTFLKSHFSVLYTEARKAERSLDADPRTALFYARRTVDLWVTWLYEHERRLPRPYAGDQLHTLLIVAEFERLVPAPIRDKAHLIRQMGNQAVHSQSAISKKETLAVLRELFQMLRWLARRYSPEPEKIPASFEVKLVPAAIERIQRATRKKLKALQQEFEAQDEALRQAKQAKSDDEARIAALQEQIARIEAQNATLPELDYSEAETREVLIDLLLREAGWDPHGQNVREYPVRGLPHTKSGIGYVDYVLWGDDGLPDPSTLQAHFAPLQQAATAPQNAFIDAIITYLSQNSTLEPAHLYEPPFTNHHYAGPDGLFEDETVDMLFDLLEQITVNSQL